MTVARAGYRPPSIRTLWAIAKSPELMLSEEDLHAVVYRETGKESIRKLSQSELSTVVRVLQNMKDGIQRDTKRKRTDEGGDPRTVGLRRRIYILCEELGWNNDNNRINQFAKRMTGVERIEWLDPAQCVKIIEGLKAMAAREVARK